MNAMSFLLKNGPLQLSKVVLFYSAFTNRQIAWKFELKYAAAKFGRWYF